MTTWRDWLHDNIETLGVSLAFAFAGSSFFLAARDRVPFSPRRALVVIVSGLLLAAVATAFVQGYLNWSPFLAPIVGLVSGLVGVFILAAVARGGERIEERAPDIADRGIDRIARKEN